MSVFDDLIPLNINSPKHSSSMHDGDTESDDMVDGINYPFSQFLIRPFPAEIKVEHE